MCVAASTGRTGSAGGGVVIRSSTRPFAREAVVARRPLTAYSTSAEQTKQMTTDLNRLERLEIRNELAPQNAHRRICMDVLLEERQPPPPTGQRAHSAATDSWT